MEKVTGRRIIKTRYSRSQETGKPQKTILGVLYG